MESDSDSEKQPLICLHKTANCTSSACEYVAECKDPTLKTHCYAVFKEDFAQSKQSESISYNLSSNFIVNNNETVPRIRLVLAGCWSGGDECHPPIFLKNKYKIENQESNMTDTAKYKIPNLLLDPNIQDMCIGYSKSPDDIGYFAKNNETFCCCSSNSCNKNIFISNERNPYEMFHIGKNPTRTPGSNLTTKHPTRPLLTQGELNAILITSVLFIFIFFILFLFVVIYKKKLFFMKNKHNLPNIFYTRDENELPAESGSPTLEMNSIHNQNQAVTNQNNANSRFDSNQSKYEMINGYLLNFNNKMNTGRQHANQLINNEEFKSLTQPLISQVEGVFPSAIVAPNIEVRSENLFRTGPIKQPFNYPDLVNRNDLKELEDVKASLEQHFLNIENNESNQNINATLLPRLLKTSDIELIEQISQGQFSSVWKGRFINSSNYAPNELPEYAIKVFSGNQRSSWSNEKDIYNTLSSTHPNILKYYCSDTRELPKTQQQMNSYFPFSTNEYWIITEYQPIGSLYDYLKANYLTWPQMIKIAYSILEGLAFLHSENIDSKKPFAIAHRDLKSKNILVKQDGQTCCIADFGLALKLNNHSKLNSAEIRSKVGTRRYMSPELIEGAIAFSKETFLRIDVYACALVLWEIISRGDFYSEKCEYKLPFEDEVGQNPSLEDMKEIVVDKSQRPIIKLDWLNYHKISSIAQTIEECWDIDLDARISSECAASRIRKIYQNSI